MTNFGPADSFLRFIESQNDLKEAIVHRLKVVDSEVVTSLWLYLRDRCNEVEYSWWSGWRAGACLLI